MKRIALLNVYNYAKLRPAMSYPQMEQLIRCNVVTDWGK